MTLESIACTHCGSGDVKEVKPDTYFCNNCDGVFKHIDAGTLSVTHSPAFCSCGNPVEVQCQLCSTMMCLGRDYFGRPGESLRDSRVIILTTGFGYLTLVPSTWHSVQDGHLVYHREDLNDTPYVPVAKLLPYLPRHRPLQHVCWDCIIEPLPRVVEVIRSGASCMGAYCVNTPAGGCEISDVAYCESDLYRGGIYRVGTWRGSKVFEVSPPKGLLCPRCSSSRDSLAKELTISAFPELELQHRRVGESDELLDVPVYFIRGKMDKKDKSHWQLPPTRKQERFDAEASRRAAGIAQELTQRLNAVTFAEINEHRQRRVMANFVFDDRSIAGSAIPGVIGGL